MIPQSLKPTPRPYKTIPVHLIGAAVTVQGSSHIMNKIETSIAKKIYQNDLLSVFSEAGEEKNRNSAIQIKEIMPKTISIIHHAPVYDRFLHLSLKSFITNLSFATGRSHTYDQKKGGSVSMTLLYSLGIILTILATYYIIFRKLTKKSYIIFAGIVFFYFLLLILSPWLLF